MRFIPTPTIAVEKLKQQAKKTKAKLKITHAEALDRVARGAGYNHWGHVTWCAKETERLADGPTLQKECDYITNEALKGRGKIVITGRELGFDRPFILFSTEDGDSWLLDQEEDHAMCLTWHGERQDVLIQDTGNQLFINWHGLFKLHGEGFHVDLSLPHIGQRTIFGYPIAELRKTLKKVQSFEQAMQNIFTDRESEELTDELIEKLVSRGWSKTDLEHARSAGAEYSPKRDSLLFPVEFGDE